MFEKITEHVYYRLHEPYTDRPTIGYVRGSRCSLLFEAGNSPRHAAQIRQELQDAALPLPGFVALSHWHWDHTFGLPAWHTWGVHSIAGVDTNRHLQKMQAWAWDDASVEERLRTKQDINFCTDMMRREYTDLQTVQIAAADITFQTRMTIDLGGVTCELILVRGPHAYDSVICYIPEDRFVFLGDSNGKNLYLLDWHFDLAHEDELVETLAALPYDEDVLEAYTRQLKQLDFTACIGGHAPPMTRSELLATLTNRKGVL